MYTEAELLHLEPQTRNVMGWIVKSSIEHCVRDTRSNSGERIGNVGEKLLKCGWP